MADLTAIPDRSNERDKYMARIDEAYREAYEIGFTEGWDAHANQEDNRNPHNLFTETYTEMEARRYGPLPENFTEPESEEHPGMARRRARACQRVNDFPGGLPQPGYPEPELVEQIYAIPNPRRPFSDPEDQWSPSE